MDDAEIRQRMRMLVQDGDLTCDEPEQTWAGTAQESKQCAGCLEPILAPQIEYEVALPSGRTMFLHARCHAIWLDVCDELEANPKT